MRLTAIKILRRIHVAPLAFVFKQVFKRLPSCFELEVRGADDALPFDFRHADSGHINIYIYTIYVNSKEKLLSYIWGSIFLCT